MSRSAVIVAVIAISHWLRIATTWSNVTSTLWKPRSTGWQIDLEKTLDFLPDHISTYELTYEKGTQFWNRWQHGELQPAHDDLRADMYIMANEMLIAAGLNPYEVSSFCKPNRHSCHNQIYWSGDPYFAFGPGAARYIDGIRATNHQSTMHYLKQIESGLTPLSFTEKLSPKDSARELLAIGLRQTDGLSDTDYYQRTRFQIGDLLSQVQTDWIKSGFLSIDNGIWKLTFRGRMICDHLASQIVNC